MTGRRRSSARSWRSAEWSGPRRRRAIAGVGVVGARAARPGGRHRHRAADPHRLARRAAGDAAREPGSACRCRLENDANAAALGEWRFGAARRAPIAGLRHRLDRDRRRGDRRRPAAARAARAGRRDRPHDDHRQRRTPASAARSAASRRVASGTALGATRRARGRAPGDGSALRRLAGGRRRSPAARSSRRRRAGDPLALSLLDEEARWLGVGFTNLLHLYSPEVIVVGGGIANGLDLMRPTIEATVRARAMRAYRGVPLVEARLGPPCRAGRRGEPGSRGRCRVPDRLYVDYLDNFNLQIFHLSSPGGHQQV